MDDGTTILFGLPEVAVRDVEQGQNGERTVHVVTADASAAAPCTSSVHSALTHLAESGVPTVLLMAKSRHASLRTLQRYARPSVEAVARLTAEHDPARRR